MDNTSPRHPPRLPEHFLAPTRPQESMQFLAHALGLAFGPGLLSYLVFKHSGWNAVLIVSAVALLSVIAGFGFYVIGTIAHEGFHFTLARSKMRSAAIGTWFSAPVIGFFGVGFHLVHNQHHRYTNASRDPDLQLFTRFRTTWSRLLLLRLVNNRGYMKVMFRFLKDGTLPEGLSTVLSQSELYRLSVLNLFAQLFWLTVYASAFAFDLWLGLCVVVIPHAMTAFISAAIVFIQHADTGHKPSDNARTLSSPLATFLMSGTNFHLEHHLYPRVPCWRLKRLHAWLKQTAWAQQNPLLVEPRFWQAMMLVRGNFPYGPALINVRSHSRLGAAIGAENIG